jgi:hypothetical protein
MIHYRPGFAPRTSDDAPAKLNKDMIPAIHRTAKETASPLITNLQAKTDAAHTKLIAARALEDAQAAAERLRAGPDILVNPNPSPVPLVNEPGK